MLYAVRKIWPPGSKNVPFPRQKSPAHGGDGRAFLKKDADGEPGWTMIAHKVLPPGRAVFSGQRVASENGASVPESPPVRVTIPHATRRRSSKSRKFIHSIHGNLKIYIPTRTRTEIL